jgi:chromosome segregation ATPase
MKKKLALIIAGALLVTSCTIFAEQSTPNLNDQVTNLQLKLNRVKQINALSKKTQTQEQQINTLTKQYKDTLNQLAVTTEQVKSANIQINNLQAHNASLRELKAQLEQQALDTQNKLTASYDAKIKEIQKNNKKNFDSFLKKNTAEKNETLENAINEKYILMEAHVSNLNKVKLEASDQYSNLLNKYNSVTKKLINKLNDSTELVAQLSKEIQDYKDKISTDNSTIVALKSTIETLSNQKKQLEGDFSANQAKTIADYKTQIDQINKTSELRIDDIKKQYAELSNKNNHQLAQAKESFDVKLETQKRILREQLDILIDSVNKKQTKLYRTAQDIADSSNAIGSAISNLKKAYQNVESPYPKKEGLSSMLGLERENPSWDTVVTSNKNLRDNIITLRAISNSLAKDNINSKQLLKENQKSELSFLGIF